jgi:hypothetical protein
VCHLEIASHVLRMGSFQNWRVNARNVSHSRSFEYWTAAWSALKVEYVVDELTALLDCYQHGPRIYSHLGVNSIYRVLCCGEVDPIP